MRKLAPVIPIIQQNGSDYDNPFLDKKQEKVKRGKFLEDTICHAICHG
jgi:hypothetical protein